MTVMHGSPPYRRSSEPVAGPPVPLRSDILPQLERILGHKLFRASQRMSRFLELVVNYTLDGRAEELKEQIIGQDVFARGAHYSPQEDPVVRIMAGRLRSKLAEYYLQATPDDVVLIELPKGGYVPRFAWRQMSCSAANPLSAPPGVARTIAVGRGQELAKIWEGFYLAASGRGMMLAVSGEAGMGKTTVAEEFLRVLSSQPASAWIARGRCSERLSETDAFAPVLEALDNLNRTDSTPSASGFMKHHAPSWFQAIVPAGIGQPGEGTETSHERRRREIFHLVQALAEVRPVVLFLDDLHWADTSTCDLLTYLCARIAELRLLILATYRPVPLQSRSQPFLSVKLEAEQKGSCRELPLPFFDRTAVEQYVAAHFPSSAFPPELSAVILDRTEGNPLFMTDLIRYLCDQKVFVEEQGRWRLTQSLESLREIIPASTQRMIRLKIEHLTATDREILRCAAVQGAEFDSAVIARTLSLDPAFVEDRLQDLERSHAVVRQLYEHDFSGKALSVRYGFVHIFYQNSLFNMLSPSRRAADSLAVGRSLQDLAGDATSTIAADLALLFEVGRHPANASRYFLQAARNAVRLFAFPEAVKLCQRGIRALLALPESTERDRTELLFTLTLGMSLMSTHGYATPEVERTHRRSRELCVKLNDTKRLMRVLWGLHTCDINGSKLAPALETALEMRKIADASGHPPSIVESLHALGTTYAFMGRTCEAIQALERIFQVVPVERHSFRGALYVLDPCVTSLSMLARVLALAGRLDEALQRAEESARIATQFAHPHSIAYATFWVGWVHHARGEHAQAVEKFEQSMVSSVSLGLPQILEWTRVLRGSSLAHLGHAARGIAEMRQSILRLSELSAHLEHAFCLTLLAEALHAQGESDEALRLCDAAMSFSAETGGLCYQVETRRVRAEAMLTLGANPVLVEPEFSAALQLAHDSGCHLLGLRTAMSFLCYRNRTGCPEMALTALRDIFHRLHPQSAEVLRQAATLLDAPRSPRLRLLG